MKAVSSAHTHEGTLTHISENAWDTVYDLARRMGQNIDRSFWSELNFGLEHNQDGVIVCFKGKFGRAIKTVTKNIIFANHIGRLRGQGFELLWITKEAVRDIAVGNWADIYYQLTHTSDPYQYDRCISRAEAREIRERRKRERVFYDLAKPIRIKKGQKAVSLEESNLQRVRSEREGRKSKTVFGAKMILSQI